MPGDADMQRSWIEYAAGAIGLLITLALLGVIGWQALQPPDGPPAVEVTVDRIAPAAGGYVVEFTARNLTSRTAAALEVEGTVSGAAPQPYVSTVTIDYVPGRSQHKGGLYFPVDPREGRLELRALGYSAP